MHLHRKLLTSGLAALAIVVTTAAAMAAPAVATGNVNVRSGPGTGYSVIDTLRRGERVDVQQCRGSWCYVEKRGADGWVSANYLASGGGRPGWNNGWDNGWDRPPPPRPPVVNPYPPRPPHWNPRPPRPQPWPGHGGGSSGSVCFNGPNGYFCIGN
ncbi:MAG: SH3 domain-containing protein [Phyllobacteriaceae bacterium]|nr:SH3 domain-containing protein [Phyllobacteriaceae bacterium]